MPAPEKKRRAATEDLVPLVYQELRQVARRYFRNQRPGFTLRPTEVVDEACLHLIQHSRIEWESSEHFRAIATRKIWQVIVDHLKKRYARKRGGVPLASATASEEAAEEPGPPMTRHGSACRWRGSASSGATGQWTCSIWRTLDALAAESAT